MDKTAPEAVKVTSKDWESLLNDFGGFCLAPSVVDSLEKDLTDCYNAILRCRGDASAAMDVSKREFGGFRVNFLIPGFEGSGTLAHVLYKIPKGDVRSDDDGWSLVHGSETHFVADWLRKFTGNQPRTVYIGEPREERAEGDKTKGKWSFWQSAAGTGEKISMYFQLNFASSD